MLTGPSCQGLYLSVPEPVFLLRASSVSYDVASSWCALHKPSHAGLLLEGPVSHTPLVLFLSHPGSAFALVYIGTALGCWAPAGGPSLFRYVLHARQSCEPRLPDHVQSTDSASTMSISGKSLSTCKQPWCSAKTGVLCLHTQTGALCLQSSSVVAETMATYSRNGQHCIVVLNHTAVLRSRSQQQASF